MKYAVKAGNDLIALAAYELYQDKAYVYLLYAESTPNSNPTMTSKDRRKYSGIGKVILAFGIKTSKEKFFIDEVTRVTWAHLQQKKTGEPVEIRPAGEIFRLRVTLYTNSLRGQAGVLVLSFIVIW